MRKVKGTTKWGTVAMLVALAPFEYMICMLLIPWFISWVSAALWFILWATTLTVFNCWWLNRVFGWEDA